MSNFLNILGEHQVAVASLSDIYEPIEKAARILVDAIKRGNKILVCGNGGSAADAQHFAAELVGRFQKERRALPAIALTTDSSILTAVGNDYGFSDIFSRQINAIGKFGDIVICISTSGKSRNVCDAAYLARNLHMGSIGLSSGGPLQTMCDYPVIINHKSTARIQECHELILHYWAEYIEQNI